MYKHNSRICNLYLLQHLVTDPTGEASIENYHPELLKNLTVHNQL